MSTSTDSVVLRDLPVDAVTTADTSTDLRGGVWTRFGSDAIRGDQVTEATLRGLAEQSREAARAQGFAAGWAEGRRGSLARTSATHDEQVRAFEERSRRILAGQQSAAEALQAAAGRAEQSTHALQAELSEKAVELALQIAEAVLGRELQAVDDLAADALRRALTSVPVDVPLTVRLHPDDLTGLDQSALADAGLADSVLADRTVTFVADASLTRGDALVETESGSVDAGVASALARVREVLGR